MALTLYPTAHAFAGRMWCRGPWRKPHRAQRVVRRRRPSIIPMRHIMFVPGKFTHFNWQTGSIWS